MEFGVGLGVRREEGPVDGEVHSGHTRGKVGLYIVRYRWTRSPQKGREETVISTTNSYRFKTSDRKFREGRDRARETSSAGVKTLEGSQVTGMCVISETGLGRGVGGGSSVLFAYLRLHDLLIRPVSTGPLSGTFP